MSKQRINITIDEFILAAAKNLCYQQNKSLSALIEDFLSQVTQVDHKEQLGEWLQGFYKKYKISGVSLSDEAIDKALRDRFLKGVK